jgi:hypothetical protein
MFDPLPAAEPAPDLGHLAGVPAGPALAEALTVCHGAVVTRTGALNRLAACQRMRSWAEAQFSTQVLQVARSHPGAWAALTADAAGGGAVGSVVDVRAGRQAVASLVDEAAVVLASTPGEMKRELETALQLHRLPATAAAFTRGDVTAQHVATVARALATVPAGQVARAEARVWGRGFERTTAQIRQSAQRIAQDLHAEAGNERLAAARACRSVSYRALPDGMALLQLRCTAPDALAALNSIEAHAAAGKDELDATGVAPHWFGADGAAATSWDARRADAAVGMLTGSSFSAGHRRPPARIQMRMHATTAMGLDDKPAYLVGHGAIPSDLAREIAPGGPWERLLSDPFTGAVLAVETRGYTPASVYDRWTSPDRTPGDEGCAEAVAVGPRAVPEQGRSVEPDAGRTTDQVRDANPHPAPPELQDVPLASEPTSASLSSPWVLEPPPPEPGYEPSPRLRSWTRARDATCRFPGCALPAEKTELDHVVPHRISRRTAVDNLQCVCSRHHRTKHTDGWTAQLHPDGTVEWTTPAGFTRTTRPGSADGSADGATGGGAVDPAQPYAPWIVIERDHTDDGDAARSRAGRRRSARVRGR